MNIDSINDSDPELNNAISLVLKVIQKLLVDPFYKVRSSLLLFMLYYSLFMLYFIY